MTTTNLDTDKLKINLLTINQYDELPDTENSELYVVNETSDLDDPGNIIASKTYADVGREAVVSQTTEPTSQYTKIWIDPDEEVVYITPASADMDNISETGSENLINALTPDFSRASSLSLTVGTTYTLTDTGWIYITAESSSAITLRYGTSSGSVLTYLATESQKASDKIFLNKGDVIYTSTKTGTVYIVFYPCKGLAV